MPELDCQPVLRRAAFRPTNANTKRTAAVSQAPRLSGVGRYMPIATPLVTRIAHSAANSRIPCMNTNGR
jgi:hypothetical protein